MLADLAGSESPKRSSARYQRLEECKFINLSLSALGNCVAALAQVCVCLLEDVDKVMRRRCQCSS